MNRRENWNLHPKAPTELEKKDLLIPYHEQIAEMIAKSKQLAYDP